MTVQMPVAAAYWAQVPGAIDSNYGKGKSSSDWYFPCNTTLPDYTFEAGGKKHTISGSYFNGGRFAHSPHDRKCSVPGALASFALLTLRNSLHRSTPGRS